MEDDGLAVGDGVDLADVAVEEAGDEAEGGDEDPLVPHILDDVSRELGVETGVADCLVERLDARSNLSAEFAVDELMDFVQLDDSTLIVESCGDHADAAENGVFAE